VNNQVIDKFNKEFTKKGFIVVNGILNQQLLSFLKISSEIIDNLAHEEKGNEVITGSSTNGQYSSIIGDTLLTYLTPYFSKISQKNLIPTYSYFRTYKKGAKLEPHKDRPSCQYSATIQINRSKDENWSFYIQNDQSSFITNPSLGQLVFYKGEEVLHWREPLKYDLSTHLFLHWVDGSDPNYRPCWFDGRPSLCLPFKPY